MADQPGEQLTLEQMLRQQVQHPELTNMTPGTESTRNQDGYNPANVPEDTGYAKKWGEQFNGQPVQQPPAASQEQPQGQPQAGTLESQVPRDEKGRFTKLYAGKYHSPEDLENAYLSQFQETQRIIAERDAIKAAQTLFNQQQQFRTREPERPQPIKVNVPQEGEPFVDQAQLESYVEQRARQFASEQIQETLGPILRSSQALNTIRATYPDYQQNEADFSKWLTVNPELAGRIAGNPEMGTEYAYLKFLRERGQHISAQAQAQAAQSQPQIDQARQHAARPNSGRSEPSENQARDTRLAQLYEHGQRTGDWRPYQKFRLSEVIPEWHVKTEWGK